MKYLKPVLALVLAAVLAAGCARINLPEVYPPATPVVDAPSPSPTYSSAAERNHGYGVSTREPLPTYTPAVGSPTVQPVGDVSGSITSTQPPAEATGEVSGRDSGEPASGAWIADAAGSLPSIQPVRMRGVWVATVANIDFPKTQGNADSQKRELEQILDNVKSWGMNTVFFQVRPMGDALYRSSLNPWSHYITGTQGQDPGWDPLAYAIEQAHARGLALHVWLNPYRAIHSMTGLEPEDLSELSFARQHPEWIFEYEGTWYFDPAVPEVRQYIADSVKEIVDNYDVDGVHFDDYFYPSNYPLPEGAERDGIIDRERRENVNTMIRMVRDVIKQKNERILFGISPFGIWKNQSSDPEGSLTNGSESYYAQAADSLAWVREKLVDYIAPQLYWTIGNQNADYEKLAAWWSEKLAGTGVSLIVGQGVSNEEVASEITRQLELNAAHPEITGSIFYNYSSLAGNPACAQSVRDFYSK